MDLSKLVYQRTVYTGFDLLSDIGGLGGMLMLIFAILVGIWQFQSFDNYMVSRLFKIRKPADKIEKGTPYFLRSEFIMPDKNP